MFKEIVLIFASVFCLSSALPVEDGRWRVVGGADAAPGEAPYQIILRVGGNFNCAGSIISARTVMTAAHCIGSPNSMTIIAGTNQLHSGGVEYAVERVLIHEDYGSPTVFNNDVALLYIRDEIQFTNTIRPIELFNYDDQEPMDVVLTGWGRTGVSAPPSENLQKLDLITQSHANCTAYWGNQITTDMICTLTRAGQGACHGDSGGPLVSLNSGKLVGIVSWGSPCAVGRPDVYGRASSYVKWVQDNAIW